MVIFFNPKSSTPVEQMGIAWCGIYTREAYTETYGSQ